MQLRHVLALVAAAFLLSCDGSRSSILLQAGPHGGKDQDASDTPERDAADPEPGTRESELMAVQVVYEDDTTGSLSLDSLNGIVPGHRDSAYGPNYHGFEDGWFPRRSLYLIAHCGNVENNPAVKICGRSAYSAGFPDFQINDYCAAHEILCNASTLLEIAKTSARPVSIAISEIIHPVFREALVYPQSSATNVSLTKASAELAANAIQLFAEVLHRRPGTTSSQVLPAVTSESYDGVPLDTLAASSFVDAYYLIREAHSFQEQFTLAVADAQRSWTTSPRQAATWSLSARNLSRAAAAHALVNPFGYGIAGDEDGGFCSVGQLNQAAQAAVDVLRTAALEPAAILAIPNSPDLDATLTIDELLNDRAGVVDSGSVAERLVESGAYPDLEAALSCPSGQVLEDGTRCASGIPEYFGLTDGDFVQARAYLAEEIRAFSRSPTAILDEPIIRTLGDYDRYSATAMPPAAIDAVYWDTLMRYTDPQSVLRSWCGPSFDFGYPYSGGLPCEGRMAGILSPVWGAAAAIDFAATTSLHLSQAEHLSPAARGTLASLAASESEERTSRITFCNHNRTTPSQAESNVVFAAGLSHEQGLLVVAGEDGLRCAVSGSIEGAPCSVTPGEMGSTAVARFTETLDSDDGSSTSSPLYLRSSFRFYDYLLDETPVTDATGHYGGFTHAAVAKFDDGDWAPDSTRLYVVQLKDGFPPDTPGSYRALAGFHWRNQTNIDWDCDWPVPVIRSVQERVARIMTPDRQNCGLNQVECGEDHFDETIPLDNELSNVNGEGVEASWRHYLTLASQAAKESDELGQTYIRSAIEEVQYEDTVEQRKEDQRRLVESELETLQKICGTSMDTASLMDRLGISVAGDHDLSNTLSPHGEEDCTDSDDCPDGTSCVEGWCTCRDDSDCTYTDEDGDVKDNASICVAGACILDPVKVASEYPDDPNLERLSNCLSEGDVVPFVTPGDKPLCLFVTDNNPNRPCDGAPPGTCPLVARTRGSNGTIEDCEHVFDWVSVDTDEGRVAVDPDWIRIAEPLGYFDATEAERGQRTENACRQLRNIRYQLRGTAGADFDALANSVDELRDADVFNFDYVRAVARRLGWKARYGGYSKLTYGDETVVRTGSIQEGPAGSWPCDLPDCENDALHCCESDERSFYCDAAHGGIGYGPSDEPGEPFENDCALPASRMAINNRTEAAVITAKYLTHGPTWVTPGDAAERRVFDAYRNVEIPIVFTDDSSRAVYRTTSLDSASMAPDYDGLILSRGKYRSNGCIDSFWIPSGSDASTQPCRGRYAPVEPYFNTFEIEGTPVELAAYDDEHIAWFTRSGEPIENSRTVFLNGRNVPVVFGVGPVLAFSPYLVSQWSGAALWRGLSYDLPGGNSDTYLQNMLLGRYTPTEFKNLGPIRAAHGSSQYSPTFEHVGWRLESDATPLPSLVTWGSVMDALELLCVEGAGDPDGNQSCEPDLPIHVESVDDLDDAALCLQRSAGHIAARGARTLFANLPAKARDALRKSSFQGAFPGLGGEMAKDVSLLRGHLIELQSIVPQLGASINRMHRDLLDLHQAILAGEIDRRIADNRFLSLVADQTNACKSASMPTVSASVGLSVGSTGASTQISFGISYNLGAIYTCANASQQQNLGRALAGLQNAQIDVDMQNAVNDFKDRFADNGESIEDASKRLLELSELIDGALASIEGQRFEARRALSRAVYLASFQAEKELELSTSMRARKDVDKVRYQRAHSNAVRMAFLAKRAIEQRLGIRLADMHEDMPLVEAPQTWESEICATSGIDYEQLGASGFDATSFADQFVGEYVRKLENLVESYRLKYGFHEGSDVAVISLRNDIAQTRALCEVPVNNLLAYSSELDRSTTELLRQECASDEDCEGRACLSSGWCQENAWVLRGCESQVVDEQEIFTRDCIQVVEEERLPAIVDNGVYMAPLYHMSVGDQAINCAETCGDDEESSWAQFLDLEAGVYRLSWFGGVSVGEPPIETLRVFESIEDSLHEQEPVQIESHLVGWHDSESELEVSRFSLVFEIDVAQVVTVSILPIRANYEVPAEFYVGGLMLERISSADRQATPGVFAATTDAQLGMAATCEDVDGSTFRATEWKERCVDACAGGYSESCGASLGDKQCFWEMGFGLSQQRIDSFAQLQDAGFARGNFNYRIESIGMNVVGTGIRDCAEAANASGCYSGAFVPYSIEHVGPFVVRNHLGNEYEAKLVRGRIEHARALSAERYLTNPLGSADRELMQDYMRSELTGRPLDGTYFVRLWIDPSIVFDRVEDVQLVLNYRYWTKFD